MMGMELQYLYRSGFAVKGPDFTMVIDYYRDSCQGLRCAENGVVEEDLLGRPGKFYVLASHRHGDHYNPVVLKWRETRKDIIYLFSHDITDRNARNAAFFLEKGQSYQDEILRVTAYGSTDEGISFAVEAGKAGKTFFHAGDLNNWHWKEEVPPEEAQGYEDAFLRELADIGKDYSYFDAVMFPVDPRLGKEYMLGGRQFLNKIRAGLFAPMHFGDHFDKAAAFEQEVLAGGGRFAHWTARGQRVEF